MSRTDFALALDAEQDCGERAGGYRHLVSAEVGVSAVDGSGVFLVARVVQIVHRDLLRVAPRLSWLNPLGHEGIGRRSDDHHTLAGVGEGGHYDIAFLRLAHEAGQRWRELKPPSLPSPWTPGLPEP